MRQNHNNYDHFVLKKYQKYHSASKPKKKGTRTSFSYFEDLRALQKLNLFTARIRSYRFPDVYKGKGILFKNEIIRLKSGKNK